MTRTSIDPEKIREAYRALLGDDWERVFNAEETYRAFEQLDDHIDANEFFVTFSEGDTDEHAVDPSPETPAQGRFDKLWSSIKEPAKNGFLATYADGENILELLASPIRKRERDVLLADAIESVEHARNRSIDKPWGRLFVVGTITYWASMILGNIVTQLVAGMTPQFRSSSNDS